MYEEVGNTAFVTFDKFVSNYAYSYYLQQEEAESGASPVQAEGTEEAGLKVSPEAAGEQAESEGYIDSIEVDTISLIIDAHKRITREGSPIENVVIDLSNNTVTWMPRSWRSAGSSGMLRWLCTVHLRERSPIPCTARTLISTGNLMTPIR